MRRKILKLALRFITIGAISWIGSRYGWEAAAVVLIGSAAAHSEGLLSA